MSDADTIAQLVELNAQEAKLLAQLAGGAPAPVTPPANPFIDAANRGVLHAPDASGKWDVSIGGNAAADGTVSFIVNGSFGTSTKGVRAVLQDGVVYVRQLAGAWVSFTRQGAKPATVTVNDPAT